MEGRTLSAMTMTYLNDARSIVTINTSSRAISDNLTPWYSTQVITTQIDIFYLVLLLCMSNNIK